MARTANKPKNHKERPVNVEVLDVDSKALPALSAQAGEVMQMLGYDLPYNRERLVQEARFYMAQSAEAMFEAGKRLIVLKENEPHGEFLEIVEERLGLPVRTAQRMMQSAIKYLSPTLASKAPALTHLGKTKLFELMTESDEEIISLVDGGTLAGATLDDIDRMTSRELKALLREKNGELEANKRLLQEKNAKIDDLTAKKKRVKDVPPDEVHAEILKEITAQMHDALGTIKGNLRQGFVAAREHEQEHGGTSKEFLSGVIGSIKKALSDLALEFDIEDVPVDEVPGWLKPGPWNNYGKDLEKGEPA